MGCPIDLVCNKGAGSSLLLKPKKIEQIVIGSSAMLSRPLTIKVRSACRDGNPLSA
jgi:tRNA-dihydrouridine synthase 3